MRLIGALTHKGEKRFYQKLPFWKKILKGLTARYFSNWLQHLKPNDLDIQIITNKNVRSFVLVHKSVCAHVQALSSSITKECSFWREWVALHNNISRPWINIAKNLSFVHAKDFVVFAHIDIHRHTWRQIKWFVLFLVYYV